MFEARLTAGCPRGENEARKMSVSGAGIAAGPGGGGCDAASATAVATRIRDIFRHCTKPPGRIRTPTRSFLSKNSRRDLRSSSGLRGSGSVDEPSPGVLCGELSQAELEEAAFGSGAFAGERRGKAVGGALAVAAFERQLADRRVQQVIAREHPVIGDGVDRREAGARSTQP